jgi:hypothetical protein
MVSQSVGKPWRKRCGVAKAHGLQARWGRGARDAHAKRAVKTRAKDVLRDGWLIPPAVGRSLNAYRWKRKRSTAGRAPKSRLQAKQHPAVRAGRSKFSTENPQNRRPGHCLAVSITPSAGSTRPKVFVCLQTCSEDARRQSSDRRQIITAESVLVVTDVDRRASLDRAAFAQKFKTYGRRSLSGKPRPLKFRVSPFLIYEKHSGSRARWAHRRQTYRQRVAPRQMNDSGKASSGKYNRDE